MNISSYVSEATSQLTQTPITSYPEIVWSYYVHYLWDYEPNSWVARIANFCRFLSILLCLPTLLLGLVDVSAYVIARTLGVIDDVKASTSDKVTQVQRPIIRVQHDDGDDSGESVQGVYEAPVFHDDDHLAAPEQPKEFFAEDNYNLKLSGVDIVSPAATRPSSPVIARKSLIEPETVTLRQRHQHLHE